MLRLLLFPRTQNAKFSNSQKKGTANLAFSLVYRIANNSQTNHKMSFNTLSTASSFRNNHGNLVIALNAPTITITTAIHDDQTKVRLAFTHDRLGTDGAMHYDFTAIPSSGSTITSSATASPSVISGLTANMDYSITCKARRGANLSANSSNASYHTYLWENNLGARDAASGYATSTVHIGMTGYSIANIFTVTWVQSIFNTAVNNNFLLYQGNTVTPTVQTGKLLQFTNTYTQARAVGSSNLSSMITSGIDVINNPQVFTITFDTTAGPKLDCYINGSLAGSYTSSVLYDVRNWPAGLTNFNFSSSNGVNLYSYAFFNNRLLNSTEIYDNAQYQLTNSIWGLDPSLSKTNLTKSCVFNTTEVKQIANSDGTSTTNFYARNIV